MAIKAFFQPLYLENIVSTDDAGSQMNMDLGGYFCGFFQNLDLIQHFLTALGPADGFLTVEGFQLGDDFLLVLDLALLV